MRYPKPSDRYSCEVLCDNFMEIEKRLNDLAKNSGGSGGGSNVRGNWDQNDENAGDYIEGRTHYTTQESVTITWDGDTTGLDSVVMNDTVTYYRVSDLVLTAEDLERCDFDVYINITNSAPFPITRANYNRDVQLSVGVEGDVTALFETTAGASSAPLIMVCSADSVDMGGGATLSKGVYIMSAKIDSSATHLQQYISRIYVPRKVKQLDQDFIPNADMSINDEHATGFVKNRTHYTEFEPKEITWDGDITDLESITIGDCTLYKVSDEVMTNDELLAANLSSMGYSNGELLSEETTPLYKMSGGSSDLSTIRAALYSYGFATDEYLILPGNSMWFIAVIRSDNCTINVLDLMSGSVITLTVPSAGTYFLRVYNDDNNYTYISKLSLPWTGKKLDECYIPDTIARKSDLGGGSSLPEGGTSGQFLVSDGNGGATWLTVGIAEEEVF